MALVEYVADTSVLTRLSAPVVQGWRRCTHYDRNFEAISEVTGQPCEWVVPGGSAP